MEERYKSVEEFISEVDMGLEIEFKYEDKVYNITYNDEGILMYQAYKYETERVYNSIEEALNDFRVGEYLLKDIILNVELLLH